MSKRQIDYKHRLGGGIELRELDQMAADLIRRGYGVGSAYKEALEMLDEGNSEAATCCERRCDGTGEEY